MEIWKEVNGYEKYLKVSNYGQVLRLGKSVKHWKGGDSYITEIFAKTSLTKKHKGYKQVKLCVDYSKKSFLVHRLVAEAFIPKVEGKIYINHIDGNKLNNNVSNLEWCTSKENSIHSVKTGLWKKGVRKKPAPFGFSNETNKPVTLIINELEFITFTNAKVASLYINSNSFTHISAVCNGKRKTAYGYNWKFAK
jgi:hypothetical protein